MVRTHPSQPKQKDTISVSFCFGWDAVFDHNCFRQAKTVMVRSFAHKALSACKDKPRAKASPLVRSHPPCYSYKPPSIPDDVSTVLYGGFCEKSYLRSGLFWFEWYLVKTIILDIKNKLLSASKDKKRRACKLCVFLLYS